MLKKLKGKAVLLFLISFVLIISGCVQVGFEGLTAQLGVGEPEYTATEKLSISAESVLDEVEGGRNTTLLFDLENIGNITVRNLQAEVTDSCIFTKPAGRSIDKLEPGEFVSWERGIQSDDVTIEKECDIRYRVSYDSNATALYDIAVISEEEYLRLKKRGQLEKKIPLTYYKTDTPVDIQISLSEDQPVLEGDEFYLTLKFVNQGDGKVAGQKLKKDNVTLEYPDFLEWKEGWCQGDMHKMGSKLKLKDSRTFYDRETTPITCKFNASKKKVEVLKQDSFRVGVKYKYVVDKKLPVKVVPS